MTLQQRVTQEILASKLFIPLFTERPELLPSLREKIVPVYGDLMQEGLGMSPKDRQMVVDDADVFISSAASINFNDPIPDALQVNYYGARRVLELAKESKRVECLVHISTVFVNSDLKKNTFIKEEMREWKDYEEVVAQAEQIFPPDDVVKNEKFLKQYNFTNSYTLTKNLAEQHLYKYRGNMRLAIVRPSIILGTYKYPFEGWVDTVSAFGTVCLPLGLGIAPAEDFDGKDFPFDLIPTDYVVNAVLVAGCYAANTPQPEFNMFQSSSSVMNTAKCSTYMQAALEYMEKNPYKKAPTKINGYVPVTNHEDKKSHYKWMLAK